jgi:hypothetical protein
MAAAPQPAFLPGTFLSTQPQDPFFVNIKKQLVRVPKVVILPQFRVHKNLT